MAKTKAERRRERKEKEKTLQGSTTIEQVINENSSNPEFKKSFNEESSKLGHPGQQLFSNASNSRQYMLSEVINETVDLYSVNKRRKDGKKFITEKRWLLKRDAIRKIAEAAEITGSTKTLLISPSIQNNHTFAFDVTVTDKGGRSTTMLGEASNENTKGISRNYKGLTAERRGFSRAVLVHTGLTNIYGEDEFIAEEEIIPDGVEPDAEVELSLPGPDEFKQIAPLFNKMTLAKTKDELKDVAREVKQNKDSYSPVQFTYLRKKYEKELLRFEESL